MHTNEGLVTAAYVVAAVLFILALGGLSNQEKAKRAIWYGIIGMTLAVAATISAAGGQTFLVGTHGVGWRYWRLDSRQSRADDPDA
jgi:NAD(P) transhydrogenase subunit beta